MSDLLVIDDCGHYGFHYDECMEPRPATLAEVVNSVRQGVESGTIKGAEAKCEHCDGEGTDGFDRNGSHAAGEYREYTCPQCDGSGRVLVIPVSDCGSET